MKLHSLLLVAGALLSAGLLDACDLCAVYNAPLAHGVVEQGFHLALAEQVTRYGTLQEDGKKVSNPAHQWMNSSVSQVAAGVHFNDRLGVQFSVPIIHRSFRRAEGGGIDEGTVSGIGDASFGLNYVLARRDSVNWTVAWELRGGVKFPTGDSSRLREEAEEDTPVPGQIETGIHGHDLALGSGSWDAYAGSEIYARYRRWFITGDVQYAIRTEGDFHYQYANDITWGGGPGYHVIYGEAWTLALQARVSGEYKEKDEFDGAKAEDTAITSLFLGPHLSLSWRGQIGAELGVALPVSIDNSALQAVPDWRVYGGFVWRF